jgi:hypothetical protein
MKINYIAKTFELNKFNSINLKKLLLPFLYKKPSANYFIYFRLSRKSTIGIFDDIGYHTVTFNIPMLFYEYPIIYNIYVNTSHLILTIYNYFSEIYLLVYKLMYGPDKREIFIVNYPIGIERHLTKD